MTWMPVVGHEGFYEVSDIGEVRGCERTVGAANGKTKVLKPRLHQPFSTKSGHLYHDLYIGRQRKKRSAHRMVLEAFVGPCPEGMECCHRDGNPANNHVGNLYWGTRSENLYDAVRHGAHAFASRSECSRGHRYEPGTYSHRKNGGRKCLICNRINQARYQARKNGVLSV